MKILIVLTIYISAVLRNLCRTVAFGSGAGTLNLKSSYLGLHCYQSTCVQISCLNGLICPQLLCCCLLSHLLMFLGSLYCKQYGPRSDCSPAGEQSDHGSYCPGSSLIWVHIVCFMIKTSLKDLGIYGADIKSRGHFQDKKNSKK